jgi:hypothetical protein
MKKFISTLFIALVAVGMHTTFAYAAIDDHAQYFSFNEGTGQTVADSVGGKNGSLTGTSTGFGFASGVAGTALGMDGTQGESVVLPDGLLSGSQGSIVLWLKVNSLSDRNVIFSARSTIDNHIYAALMIDSEGRPQFQFRTTTDGADQKIQGGKTLNKGEWYQLVFTASAQNYQFFLNGEVLTVAGYNTGRWFPELVNHNLAYRIGSIESGVVNGVFDGYLDEFRIYARPLTQDDVTVLYNGGNPGTPDMPLAAKQALAAKAAAAAQVTEIVLGGGATTTLVTSPVLPTIATTVASPVAEEKGVPFVLTRNLSVGARGDDVRAFQLLLITKGYLGAEYATGYFGMLTKAAAIKLQKAFALPQTGFIGPMTRAKLGASN